jgi:hypothetical protein
MLPMTVKVATCTRCNKDIFSSPESISSGYGLDKDNNRICYGCCAVLDKERMRQDGKITLYLTCEPASKIKSKDGRICRGKVSNWPGTLEFICHTTVGNHNIAKIRYDCWFIFEGYYWHGVTYGDNTQICHCKRTKDVAPSMYKLSQPHNYSNNEIMGKKTKS